MVSKRSLSCVAAVAAASFAVTPGTSAQAAQPQSSVQTTTAQQAPVAKTLSGEATANRSSWHTFPGGHRTGTGLVVRAKTYKRPKGVRMMQVKARCWGNDSRMRVSILYRTYTWKWKVARTVTQRCNGRYGTARISNAGHTWYSGRFAPTKRKAVEYWVQYYK